MYVVSGITARSASFNLSIKFRANVERTFIIACERFGIIAAMGRRKLGTRDIDRTSRIRNLMQARLAARVN